MIRVSRPKAVVVLGQVDFQRVVDGKRRADKAHHVITHLSEELGWDVLVVPHVESMALPTNAYTSVNLGVKDWIFLTKSVAKSLVRLQFSVLADSPISFMPFLRRLWAESRLDFWRHKFVDISARAVFGIGLTAQEVAAARTVGISTFEIQHGVFERRAVNLYWPNERPDYFCLWPTSNPELLEGTGIEALTIPSFFSAPKNTESQDSRLLVPLSWGEVWETSPTLFQGAIANGVYEVLSSANRAYDNVVFRDHPVFPRKRIRSLRKSLERAFPGSSFEASNQRPIEDFISGARGVLIERSTVWLDAFFLSVPVLTVSKSHLGSMHESINLEEHDLIHLVQSGEELERALLSIGPDRSESPKENFTPGPVTWNGLDEILGAQLLPKRAM